MIKHNFIFKFMNRINQSPFRKFNDPESDHYSINIVEELLQGSSEWRNTNEIVRMSLRALTDVVKM